MPLTCTIDEELGIVRITVEGSPMLDEQAELGARLMSDPAYRAGMPILLDNRLREKPADTQHVTEVAKRAMHSLMPKGTRCAVVVGSDVQYGMTRMFASMSEGQPLITKPFRDISSAEQWLLSSEDDA